MTRLICFYFLLIEASTDIFLSLVKQYHYLIKIYLIKISKFSLSDVTSSSCFSFQDSERQENLGLSGS
jgi:hypothetical protein